ncbi:MAG: lactate utilization protein [Deltaproteobacteria bacterium]|nr:lactate utilization protein [Deltaproteobacteria bacterium]
MTGSAWRDPLEQMDAAVLDRSLREALDRALGLARRKRDDAMEELPDPAAARRRAAEIRRYAVDNLGALLRRLEDALEAGGVRVHWARDAAEAVSAVCRVAEAAGVRTAALSKSMVAEELGLEKALTGAGIEVVQTDLGERILQLSQDRPSHITAPCLHLRAEDVGRIFERTLGTPFSDDPERLSRAAAADLRPRFLSADLGITGVNVAVADSGTLVIVENEGNVRMVTTLPRILVSVTGIEKVVPDRAAALDLLQLLGRSATGQRWPGYITWMPPAWPREGPRPERHVVLVDNGRSRVHASGRYRSLLWCIRCGACMNACPVYGRVGGHAYGTVIPGPVGAALSPLLAPGPGTARLPQASSLCGECANICPVMIPLHSHLVHLRGDPAALGGHGGPGPRERLSFRLWRWFMGGRRRYGLSLWLHRMAERLAPRLVGRVAARLGWGGLRLRPRPAEVPFRARWRVLSNRPPGNGGPP